MEVNRPFLQSELRALLQALASPGRVALDHAPPGSCRPDELALDYENFVRAFVGNFGDELSVAQKAALLRVQALFDAMGGEHQIPLWDETAVVSHPRWAEIRAAAAQALDVMSWRSGRS